MFARLTICIYAPQTRIYGHMHPCAQSALHIYIYMLRKAQKYRAQATGAAGSCSKHEITIHRSPPEAT